MAKLVLIVELDYDDVAMHGNREESKEWFFNEILHEDLILHSNSIGDTIGSVRVISVRGEL